MIYTTKLLFWTDALTINSELILMRPDFANSTALITHERTHQAQMARMGTFTFWRKYLASKSFRQAMEVEAYKAQIAAGASLITCARHLATDYRLGITQAQAMVLLQESP